MTLFDIHRGDLARLSETGRLRGLAARKPVDFASNDYLGFAGKGLLREAAQAALDRGVAIGAMGSRLLGGNDPEHEALEAYTANLFGAESALYFSSGFAANSALFATVPQHNDRIFHDRLVHASAHDGFRLARAQAQSFTHNDPQACDDAIRSWREGGGTGTAWIAIESLYSMDGDLADIAAFAEIAERHEAVLVVDEAHAVGTLGPRALGLADLGEGKRAPDYLVRLVTCGKALGCEGALIIGPRIVSDFLINRARPFIFSTAPSPLMAAIAQAALQKLVAEPEHLVALQRRIALARQHLPAAFAAPRQANPILPIIIGDDVRTMRLANTLQERGLDVRGIRPPTVPEGTSRLRISITNNVSPTDIETLFAELAAVIEAV